MNFKSLIQWQKILPVKWIGAHLKLYINEDGKPKKYEHRITQDIYYEGKRPKQLDRVCVYIFEALMLTFAKETIYL